ncbi:ABC transporter, ATP-binding protein [Mycoplasmopsis alligatoris A21JP2]|uniref:ABC transporter, ATP-binding protein n=1 Tax=Mycoplasmopsis alligatoris A21JP2 TaxID=747682 RepID=D4XVK5_9BACT|nr:ATP-binding cassette domain-containing protein [Mycoplasmopsis alligatoris]EFF41619.1 ABC transporter, ATP-binding protein [Mycoplasmopsis alligatoris A21JP2]
MKQIDSKECSLLVIKYFYDRFYQKSIPIEILKSNADYDEIGIKIDQISLLAAKYGLNLSAYKCDFKSLLDLEKSEYPISIIINRNDFLHLIVIKKKIANHFLIYDPIDGHIWLNHRDLSKIYVKLIVTFKKQKYYVPKKYSLVSNLGFSLPYFLVTLIFLISKLLSPLLARVLLSNIYYSFEFEPLITLILLFIWFAISTQIFYTVSYKLINNLIIKKIEFNASKYIEKIQQNPLKTIFKYNDNELLNRFNAIKSVEEFRVTFLSNVIIDLISLLASFFYLYYANLVVLIIVFSYAFISLLIGVYINININFYSKQIEEKNTLVNLDLINIFNEYRYNSRDFLISNIKNKYSKNYQELNNKNSILSSKLDFWNSIHSVINTLIPFIIYSSAIYYYWTQKLPLYEFIIYLSGINLLSEPLKGINSKITIFNKNRINLSIIETFNIKEKINKENIKLKNNLSELNVKNLKLFLKGKLILNINNLVIKNNVHLIGKNGIGKSTFLKLLSGFYEEYEGKIILKNNQNSYDLEKTYLNNFYLSNEQYFSDIKIIDYISDFKKINEDVIDQIFNKYQIYDLLEISKIDLQKTMLNNANNLSTGQKRIVSFLKIILTKPDYIFLDEAFENIQNDISNKIKNVLIFELNNSTFVEISHNNNFVHSNVERINFEKINNV